MRGRAASRLFEMTDFFGTGIGFFLDWSRSTGKTQQTGQGKGKAQTRCRMQTIESFVTHDTIRGRKERGWLLLTAPATRRTLRKGPEADLTLSRAGLPAASRCLRRRDPVQRAERGPESTNKARDMNCRLSRTPLPELQLVRDAKFSAPMYACAQSNPDTRLIIESRVYSL